MNGQQGLCQKPSHSFQQEVFEQNYRINGFVSDIFTVIFDKLISD